ncbi:MAG: disulfide bond formation protein B [Steroidobacteraceae bacterium]
MSQRVANLVGFAACAGLMGYALYAEHVLHLEPCPLCIFQRIAVIAIGIVFLLAALQDAKPVGSRVYAGLIVLAAGAGSAVAMRHLWIQSLPADKVPACGAPLDQLMQLLPLRNVIETVLRGDGECAKANWKFLGLAMPAWVLIACVALALWGLYFNLRRPSRRV